MYMALFSYTSQTGMNLFYCTFIHSMFSFCLPLLHSSLVQYGCTHIYFLTNTKENKDQ